MGMFSYTELRFLEGDTLSGNFLKKPASVFLPVEKTKRVQFLLGIVLNYGGGFRDRPLNPWRQDGKSQFGWGFYFLWLQGL